MQKKNILDLEKRMEIYKFISKNPGIYQNEISRKLDISKTSTATTIFSL